MIRTFGIIALFLLLLTGNALASPVGMATELTGKVEVRPASGNNWKTLRLLDRLETGDTVRCGPGAEAVLVLFESAERYTVSAGATAVVEARSVKGASKNSGLRGPAIQIAKTMVGDRPSGFIARPALSHKRMTPQFSGWMPEGERHFDWEAIPGAASYSFTLFDTNDNVIWSARVAEPKADYPADLPNFALKRPYLWRVSAFGKSGKPLTENGWGVVTFLSKTDGDALTQAAKDLESDAQRSGDSVTPLVLLAELYRSYGVLEKTLETLERPQLENQSGIRQAQDDVYRQLGSYAFLLAKRTPADETSDKAKP